METRLVRLVNGPYDHMTVEADGRLSEICVYRGLYGHVLAIRPGAFQTPSMATYEVLPSGSEAIHVGSA
jgi:hypothetical protein